ncbi:MAG TPA: acyl-CoA thioesterase domain-containing protein [Acidimicrobiales bacterium]|nr:acyl-CoA thioesterase domain-containing protein [Acidimicrobiales bacterium]
MTTTGEPAPLHDDVRSVADIEEDGPDRFRGRTPPSPTGRVFGGIVVAQALMAAVRSVGPSSPPAPGGAPPLRPHSLHGYFLNPAVPDAEVSFAVEPLRDSRSFALRQVTAVQQDVPRARLLCSFHIDEQGEVDCHVAPPTAIDPPGAFAPSGGPMLFDMRVAEPVAAGDGTFVSSGRHWVRVKDPLPDDPVLHCCLLAYFSDQTRLSFRPYTEEAWGTHTDASLDHAVWLHRPARADRWLRYELQALSAGGNRATVRGLMFDEGGALVMSMAQELLVRPVPGAVPQVPPWLLGAR